ncbi:MAG: hypothetical protein M3434_11120, partial [Gemmatimonadota bacterium]|nr:hypothetical protein [Gemmatimonadota bacterium]
MNQSVRKFVAPAALLLGFGGVVTAIDAVRDPIPALDAQAAQSAAVGPQSLATAFRTASRTALAGVV